MLNSLLVEFVIKVLRTDQVLKFFFGFEIGHFTCQLDAVLGPVALAEEFKLQFANFLALIEYVLLGTDFFQALGVFKNCRNDIIYMSKAIFG